MPEVTDPELLAMLNGGGAPAAAPGPIYGAPDPQAAYRQSGEARAQAGEARANQDQAIQYQQLDLSKDAARRAEEAANRAERERIPAAAATGIQENLKTLREIDTALAGLKKRPESIGTGTGALGEIFTQWHDPDGTGVRASIGAVGAFKIHDLSGAAVSASEAPRFTPFVPTVQDRPEVAQVKLEKFREQLQAQIREANDFYTPANGYRPYVTPGLDEALRPDAAAAADEVDKEGFTARERAEGITGTATDTSVDSPPGPGGGPGGGGGIGDGLLQGVSSIVEGAASIPAIVVDPIATTIGRAMGYDNYTSDFATQVRSDLGLPKNQDNVANTIIGGGVSALTGSFAGRGASMVASSAPVRSALSTFGATPGRDAVAGAGASALGMIGQAVGGTPGQIAGTLVGGVAGYGAANRLARAGTGVRTPNALMAAADRQKVDMLPADVGGVGTRMATGATGMTLGGIPLAEGAERSVASAGRARNRIASAISEDAGDATAGQAARRGFKQFERSSLARGGELFERVSVPAESKVQLGQTRGALAEVTRGMQSNPELSKLWANHPRLRATLEALTPEDLAPKGREAFIAASEKLSKAQDAYQVVRSGVTSAEQQNAARLAVDDARAEVQAAQEMASKPPEGGELSWEDMKRFRSTVGEIVGQPGVAADGSDVAGLRKLYGALSSDMEVTAARAGPKALQEFKRANQYWRGREGRLEDVFSSLFGSQNQKSDEAVFRTLNTWAQSKTGDFTRLARTIRSMPADEADTVRATVVQKLGQATPANGGAEVFAPDVFATQWKSLSDRAKTVLFPNKQHRQDLEDVAMITDAMKRAGSYRNTSKTALGANFTATGLTALTGPAGILTAAAYSGGTFSLGKLLASPRVARAIASTKKLPEEEVRRTLSQKLGVIAANDPGLRADAKGLQDYLMGTVAQSPATRAAASEQEQ
jgi:hypothetical protein